MSVVQPGGVLWLLAHELRLSWRRLSSGAKAGGAGKRSLPGRVIGWIVLIVFVVAIGAVLALPLSRVAPTPPDGPIAILSVMGVIAVLATLMISQAIMGVVEVVYVRNDLDLLLASPIKPWTILLVRTGAVALTTALFYFVIAGAFVVWMAIFGAPAWLVIVPALLGLALGCTGLGLFLVIALFRTIGPRQTRVVAQILGAVIGAGFFLGFQLNNLSGMGARGGRGAVVQTLLEYGRTHQVDPDAWYWFPARAALGDGAALLAWLALCVLLFLSGAWLFSRGFVADAAAAAGMSRGRRRARDGVRALRGGLVSTIVRKELRLLRRDPLLVSQVGLQLIYFLPIGFLVWRNVGDGPDNLWIHLFVAGAMTSLAGFLTGGLIWITASAEEAPDLIASAPIKRALVDRGKLIAAIAPALAVLAIPLVAIAWDSPLHAFWIALFSVAACISAGYIGIWYQRPGAKRTDFRRRRSGGTFLSNLGQGLINLGWGGAAALAVSGWAVFSIVPALIALGLVLAMGESRPEPV